MSPRPIQTGFPALDVVKAGLDDRPVDFKTCGIVEPSTAIAEEK
jgi:hypothetical protein